MKTHRGKRSAAMPSGSPCWPSYEVQTLHKHGQTKAITLLLLLMLPAAGQELTTSITDAGGGLSTRGDIEIESSLGGFGGVSSDAGEVAARAGFSGQIYDPVSVAIAPGSAALQENDFAAFTAEIVCDDDTLLPGSAVAWSVDSGFLSVTAAGEVTTGLLPGGFAATLTASAGDVSGTAILTVVDTDPDNYRGYAGDGLPDNWQILHFGDASSEAGPAADPDGDGQDNVTEYSAGTDPNDPNSLIRLAFAAPGAAGIVFSPSLPDRTYTLEWSATLDAAWTPLPGLPVTAAGPGEGLITDPAAAESRRLYRLRITRP